MTPYKKRLNKYIKRMAEDMQLRNFADATIDAYTYHADKFCSISARQPTNSDPNKYANTSYFLSMRKKSVGAPSTKQSVAYGFSTKLPSRNRGPSSTFPSASDRRRCPWSSPIKKQATSSHVSATPNIEPS